MKHLVLTIVLSCLMLAYANDLTVTVTDEGISVPSTLESGYTQFVLDNQASKVYAHEIVKVKDGTDPDLFRDGIIAFFSGTADEATIGTIMETMDVFVGGAVGTIPGNTRSVGVVLTPGTYVMYADQISGEGLIIDEAHTAIITVTEGANPAPEPTPDYTVKMAEYAFALPADLTAGTHLVKFENLGKEDHLGFVFKLPDGMTIEEAMHDENPDVDWSEVQGVHAVGGGSATYVEMTLEPGATYLFDCAIPNDEGVPHDEMGMMQFVTIPE
jgi:hypothetical protein